MANKEPGTHTTAVWERQLAVAAVVLSAIVLLPTNVSTASAFCSSALVARRSLASAIWVWKFDPLAYRGRICAMFHLSVAFWLGAPAALLVLVACILVHKKFGLVVPESEINATLIALLASVASSAVVCLVAAIAAWKWRVRVWVHPRFVVMLGDGLMQTAVAPASNFGIFVLATSLTTLLLPVFALIVANSLPAFAVVGLVPLFIGVVVVPCILLSSRIFASSPAEYLSSHR